MHGGPSNAAIRLHQVQVRRGYGAQPLLVGAATAKIRTMLRLRPGARQVARRISARIRARLDQRSQWIPAGPAIGRALARTAGGDVRQGGAGNGRSKQRAPGAYSVA